VDGLLLLSFRNLLLWLVGWSLIGLLLMGEDKDQAGMQDQLEHRERISEKTLHQVALIGGFFGIIIGARIFHHKTSKSSFWPPIGVSLVLWAILLFIVVKENLLPNGF